MAIGHAWAWSSLGLLKPQGVGDDARIHSDT